MEDEEDIVRIMQELKMSAKQKEAADNLFYYLIKHRIEPEKFIDNLRGLLFSTDKVQQNGGFLAVNKILEVGRETKVLHFVTAIMPQIFKYLYQYDNHMMNKAVECLGNLAQSGGNSTSENVERQFDTCFEWIRTKAPKMHIFGASDSKAYNKKLAAILVLTQYCEKMPTLTYNRLVSTALYTKLFDALGDSKTDVRVATIDFFKAISRLIIQRDRNERKNFYESIYFRTIENLKSSDQYMTHGSLLVFSFLLTDSDGLVTDKHEEMFKYIMSMSDKKGDLIRPQCIKMFPLMAQNGPQAFSKYTNGVIEYLLEIAKQSKSSNKGLALKSLGQLSVIIESRKFKPEYVEQIIMAAGLEIKTPKSNYFNDALDTIANLCKKQGEVLESLTDVIDMINEVFKEGLNKNLIQTLTELSRI